MRTAIFFGLLAATIVPGIANAQSGAEIRGDRRELRQERRDVDRARDNGAPGYVVRDERRDVRDSRQELHEDWRDYRNAHPNDFRGPRYAGPRGYNYRAVTPGYRFAPSYYDRRYWVDGSRYHLGAAGRYERWIRYGNDVVLVDIRNGRTIRVFNRFFF